ncbi:hypothetical protein EVAR_85006_1 [Eumeta japonica]|uniref:EF-hand domain-containing protein n=1 Tax=Eumeta variegata TaxID=151549 RepID=A0A4C1WB89_EUMVA|nr:hypothetical protein EVAR_85006_1 [Eumeta japonica]
MRQTDVWRSCNKIRAAVFRTGVDLRRWLQPLDPRRTGLLSESQFVSVLAGPLRAAVALSADEIAQLADYFRAADGRVLYQQLCELIHGQSIVLHTF